MQVSCQKPLDLLKKFLLQEIDLRTVKHNNDLQVVRSELPAFWAKLLKICQYEKTKYLPIDIRDIVLQLLKIWEETFSNAPKRKASDN